MSLTYEEAKKLQEANYPGSDEWIFENDYPSLEELIEACGEGFECLIRQKNGEYECCDFHKISGDINSTLSFGNTPTQAVAALWIALQANKK